MRDQDPHVEHRRKFTLLVVAVVVATGFIAAAWAYIVPPQMSDFSFLDEQDQSRWQVIRDETSEETRSLRDNLLDVQAQLKVMDELAGDEGLDSATEVKPKQPVLTDAEIDKLRARIEAASRTETTE